MSSTSSVGASVQGSINSFHKENAANKVVAKLRSFATTALPVDLGQVLVAEVCGKILLYCSRFCDESCLGGADEGIR
jgi:hypothetical protein